MVEAVAGDCDEAAVAMAAEGAECDIAELAHMGQYAQSSQAQSSPGSASFPACRSSVRIRSVAWMCSSVVSDGCSGISCGLADAACADIGCFWQLVQAFVAMSADASSGDESDAQVDELRVQWMA